MHPSEQVIFTNMCMVYDPDGNAVVQERTGDWPGVVFPGGHVEQGETFTQAVIREVWEETGLTIRHPRLCGVKHWMRHGVRNVVFLYKTGEYEGELRSSGEGRVWWMPVADMPKAKLANTMGDMLQLFLREDLNEFSFREENGQWVNVLE